MAILTIRDLDESLKRDLRARAASRNRSMEEEARQILRAALLESPVPAEDLACRIRARSFGLGDVELSVPARERVRTPPRFDADPKAFRAAPAKTQDANKTACMSVLLDTNVLPEFLRARRASAVLAWFAAQPSNGLFVSTVTQAEMMLGARLLPAG